MPPNLFTCTLLSSVIKTRIHVVDQYLRHTSLVFRKYVYSSDISSKYIMGFLMNGLYVQDVTQFDASAKSISNFRFDGDNY
jgi:hypothetical protein